MKKLLLVFLSILVLTLFSSCIMSFGTAPYVYPEPNFKVIIKEYYFDFTKMNKDNIECEKGEGYFTRSYGPVLYSSDIVLLGFLSYLQQTNLLIKSTTLGIRHYNFVFALDENNDMFFLTSTTAMFMPSHFLNKPKNLLSYKITSIDIDEIQTKALSVSGLSSFEDNSSLEIYYDGYTINDLGTFLNLFVYYSEQHDPTTRKHIFKWFDVMIHKVV